MMAAIQSGLDVHHLARYMPYLTVSLTTLPKSCMGAMAICEFIYADCLSSSRLENGVLSSSLCKTNPAVYISKGLFAVQ